MASTRYKHGALHLWFHMGKTHFAVQIKQNTNDTTSTGKKILKKG